jgi:hypothetical protein
LAHAYAPELELRPAPQSQLARIEIDARRIGPRWALLEFCRDRVRREGAVLVRGFGSDGDALRRLLERGGFLDTETGAPRHRTLHCLLSTRAGAEDLLVDARDPLEGARHRFTLGAGDFVLYDEVRMQYARGGGAGSRWVRELGPEPLR